jgi:cell filamentation protein
LRERWQQTVRRVAQSPMPPESNDPYIYPGTRVLKNKADIRDTEAFKCYEYERSKFRLEELREKPLPGNFDLAHLQAIHQYIFQDVYEWAGQVRTINIMKGDTAFALAPYIENEGRKLSAALLEEWHLQGLDKAPFVERLAHYYAEWNVLHPFRESNGRATREFLSQLARAAGYELDQTRIENDNSQWHHAAERSFYGDLAPAVRIFTVAVRPR